MECSFKYEDLRTVLSMFNRGDYVITFDLKSGYHHVDTAVPLMVKNCKFYL